MAAYDSGLLGGSTANLPGSPSPLGPAGSVGPFPSVIGYSSVTNNAFTGNQTLEVVFTGAGNSGYPQTAMGAPSGTFSLFAGVDSQGRNGNFVCKITPGTQSSGVSIGSGTQGYDLYAGGKVGYSSMAITIPAAKLNYRSDGTTAAIESTTGYIAFVPQDGNHAGFVCQLTGTIT